MDQRKRLTAVKFLGELYNYRMVESGVIFDCLYSLVVLGHGTPPLQGTGWVPRVLTRVCPGVSVSRRESRVVVLPRPAGRQFPHSVGTPSYAERAAEHGSLTVRGGIEQICTLLDSCGMYFDHGSLKKRLERFLTYFQVPLS